MVADVEARSSIRSRDVMASVDRLGALAGGLVSEHEEAALCCYPASFSPVPIPIEDLELPVRAYVFLKRSGVHSVGDLVDRHGTGRPVPHLTAQDVEALRDKLAAVGIRLDEPECADPDVGDRQWA